MKVTDMHKHLIILCITIIMLAMTAPSFAVSTAVKAQNDLLPYSFTAAANSYHGRNFGDEATKNKYQEIQALFQNASEEYYGQNFDSAHQK